MGIGSWALCFYARLCCPHRPASALILEATSGEFYNKDKLGAVAGGAIPAAENGLHFV